MSDPVHRRRPPRTWVGLHRHRIISAALLIVGLWARPAFAHFGLVTAEEADRRIAFYLAKLEKDPRLYPAHAELGRAYLDKAAATFDPAYLAKARSALDRSLEIQPNLDAYVGQLAVAAYAHCFEDALRWGALAQETAPQDTSVLAKIVEAHLGLGHIDQAEALVRRSDLPADDFHVASARGHVLRARGQLAPAAQAFTQAAAGARRLNQPALAQWALVRAAEVLLEAGKLDEADSQLELAGKESQAAPSVDLLFTHGKLLESKEAWSEAMAIYQRAFRLAADPIIDARISFVAHRLGEEELAKMHFSRAEQAYRKVLDAGEVYSLGALARLYCDAGMHLDEAEELAERNLKYVRDKMSVETLEEIKAKRRHSP